MTCRSRIALALCSLMAASAASHAAAQAELTGTYVRYVSVGANGTMICTSGPCVGGHSMQYGETVAGLPSCDLYYPGSPQESFTVEATPMGGSEVTLTNSGTSTGSFAAISGPTVVGRTITWSGRATSGTVQLRIDQTFELEVADRFVRLTVTITNEGTVALSDVYYLRNGDPDHGECSIGTSFATGNDVLRQPPTDDGALATSLGGTAPNQLVVGIGAHDPRARAYNGGFTNTDASTEWTTPMDSGGALLDEAVDLIFKELTLAPSASTTFEMFYVWGPDVTTVETRFDELGFPTAPCVGLAEGAACTTSSGDSGLCRATRCCTGCFDGSRCRAGSSATLCGAGGVSCASCADTDACTSDVCTAGVCSNPSAPSGTACNDGLFCTLTDTCNGSGTCLGAGDPCNDLQSCTTDSCNETSDSCTNAGLADGTACTGGTGGSGLCHASACCLGCWDGVACRAGNTPAACGASGGACASCVDGDACTTDVCAAGLCSNPSAPSGTTCDDSMFCTATDRCDGAGACVGAGVRCNDGQSCTVDTCDETADACMFTPTAGCIIGGECVGDGVFNVSNSCQVCDPARDMSDWSLRPTGTVCGSPLCASGSLRGAECDATGTCQRTTMRCPTGRCADAVSCEAACTAGSCASDEWCNTTTGVCEMQGDLGAACTDSAGCTSGFCADGVCCDGACDGTCENCDTSGACDAIPAGMDPDDECATACDGAGACEEPDAGTPPDAGPRDAGTSADAAVATDAGIGFDAGGGVDDGGCGCRASGARDRSAPFWLMLLLATVLARRRRRREKQS